MTALRLALTGVLIVVVSLTVDLAFGLNWSALFWAGALLLAAVWTIGTLNYLKGLTDE